MSEWDERLATFHSFSYIDIQHLTLGSLPAKWHLQTKIISKNLLNVVFGGRESMCITFKFISQASVSFVGVRKNTGFCWKVVFRPFHTCSLCCHVL